MAMTTFSDVIIPEVFSEYLMEPIREANALFASGIVKYDALLASKLDFGGDDFTFPYWGALSATGLEAPTESTEGTINKITSGTMRIPRIFRTYNVGSTQMASILAGSNAMVAIQERVTEIWKDGLQNLLINIAKGILGTAGGLAITEDVAAASGADAPDATNLITKNAVIDAKALLGDKAGSFKAIVLHSKVKAELDKIQAIQSVLLPGDVLPVEMFMNMRVIQDDNVPTVVRPDNTATTPVDYVAYYSLLIKEDGFRYGDSEAGFRPVYIKESPELGMGVEVLYTKKMLSLHPRGASWTPTGVTATKIEDADLALSTNWTYSFDPQESGFVALITNA